MAALDRWKYYVSSYTMRDQTEGVPQDKTFLPYLRRNLPPTLDSLEEYERVYSNPQFNHDGLTLRISAENYHILYEPLSNEWFVQDDSVRKLGMPGMQDVREERKRRFEEKFVRSPKWMADLSKEDVERKIEEAARLIKGVTAEAETEIEMQQSNEAGEKEKAEQEQDDVMTGA